MNRTNYFFSNLFFRFCCIEPAKLTIFRSTEFLFVRLNFFSYEFYVDYLPWWKKIFYKWTKKVFFVRTKNGSTHLNWIWYETEWSFNFIFRTIHANLYMQCIMWWPKEVIERKTLMSILPRIVRNHSTFFSFLPLYSKQIKR